MSDIETPAPFKPSAYWFHATFASAFIKEIHALSLA